MPTAAASTSTLFSALEKAPRLLMECELKPLQGDRFQSTGFADLGPARYQRPDGTEMLLVESAQSVANRLESSIWDAAEDDLIAELRGLPYVSIDCGSLGKTNSINEFHRLNSPYIWSGESSGSALTFREAFVKAIGLPKDVKKKSKGDGDSGDTESVAGVLDFHKLYKAVFKYDPNAVIHGLFLEKVAGRLRMPRLLSGFIEATDVREAASGGTKVDNVLPSPKVVGLDAKEGYGNVPFARTEFVAREITAYFNLDLALLRGYGLPDNATKLLIALSLLKVQRFLASGLRLRSACDLEPAGNGLIAKRPAGWSIPPENVLMSECKSLIDGCAKEGLFAEALKDGDRSGRPVTLVEWKKAKKASGKDTKTGDADQSGAGDDK